MAPGLLFQAASSKVPARASRRPVRVVVIDDMPDTVMTLLALLRNEGYEAEGFGSGREAMKKLEDVDPDVVICDIAMPSMNGWDLAREVRRSMGDSRPMLIAISGQYTKGSDRVLAEMAGFNYYLVKPCDPRVLMNLLKLAPTK
jgi:DNA-binding response OmpR family regulator